MILGDGASLTTFFRKARKREPTLLVVKAMGGQVFGGFASKAWIDKGEVSCVEGVHAWCGGGGGLPLCAFIFIH